MREVVSAVIRFEPPETLPVSESWTATSTTSTTMSSVPPIGASRRRSSATRSRPASRCRTPGLNDIMKKLAAWAAIIAVPTAVTGWFGQNLRIPATPAAPGCCSASSSSWPVSPACTCCSAGSTGSRTPPRGRDSDYARGSQRIRHPASTRG
uniref:hypothetical protein n=1 Tax=Tessaracoccus sp. TaxID=1971211 RepID=UPI00345064D7